MGRSSRFRAVLGLAVVAAASGVSPARADSPLQSISSDPYTNPISQHMTEVEPHDFAVGNTVIAAFQVGRFSEAGASGIGWARSGDGGSTWSNGFLPGLTADQDGGPYASASDPVVGYDAKHSTWLISSLGNYGSPTPGHFLGSDVVVSGSTDGGTTWGNPVVVGFGGTPTILDKPWVACDNSASSPHYGSCYMTWDDYDAGDLVYVSTSTDGGATWSSPAAPAGVAHGLGGVPVVMPSGRVVVPFLTDSDRIGVFSSADGGATWSRAHSVASVGASFVNGGVRASPMPAVSTDAEGNIFVLWSACVGYSTRCRHNGNDLLFSRSTDEGASWANPRRIPVDRKRGDLYGGTIAVDPGTWGKTAHLAVTYYVNGKPSCGESTCQVDVRYTSSIDGGRDWSRAIELAGPMHPSWAPSTGIGRMFGDYFGMAIVGDGSAVPVVSVALAPGGAFDQSIWSGRLTITGGTKPALAPAASVTLRRSSVPLVPIGVPRR